MRDRKVFIKQDYQGIEKNPLTRIEHGAQLRIMFNNGKYDHAYNVKSIYRYLNALNRKSKHGKCYVWDQSIGNYRFYCNF